MELKLKTFYTNQKKITVKIIGQENIPLPDNIENIIIFERIIALKYFIVNNKITMHFPITVLNKYD